MRGMSCQKVACVVVRPRRGLSILYVVIILAVLVGFVSLAVDVGRIRLARAEIQTASDSAARAGAYSLPVNSATVINHASVAADSNPVIDTETSDADSLGARTNPGLVLDNVEDIEFGIWNTSTHAFSELTDVGNTSKDERRRSNAVRVIGRRIQERNNPVPLIFAPVVGVFSTDIEREAVAYIHGGPVTYGFVGIDSVSSNGNGATIDSVQLPSTTRRYNGAVSSDGNIDLGNGDVYGDARPGIGRSLIQGPNSVVTGWTANLDYNLAAKYPPKTVPGSATAVTLPGNNKDWTLPPSGAISNDPNNPRVLKLLKSLDKIKKLTVNGYVTLYVTGNVNLQGNSVSNSGTPLNPSKLNIIVVGANTSVDMGGNSTQYMHVYAPQSTVRVHGTRGFYGWIVGKTLSFIGTSDLHYDESIVDNTPYKITLVK